MDGEPRYIRPVGQLPIDPSQGSIILLIAALLMVVGDIFLVRNEPFRDGSFARNMPNPTKWRRAFASIFLFMAAGSGIAVASFQSGYFQGAMDLRKERARHYSIYPLTLEQHVDYLPRMFSMLHIRSWAGSASSIPLEWTGFFWWAQQYFAGLMNFIIFLIVQSRIRRFSYFVMCALVYIAMTSLSLAQCCLFFYILMTPPVRRLPRFDSRWLLGSVIVVGSFFIWNVYRFSAKVGDSRFQMHLLWLLLSGLAIPILQLMIHRKSSWNLRSHGLYEAQVHAFFPGAILTLVIHLFSTWISLFGPGVHDYNPYAELLHRTPHVANKYRRFAELKEDPALAAVACDVMLSFLISIIWTAISSASVWGIVRCTMNPYAKTGQIPFLDDDDEDITPDVRRYRHSLTPLESPHHNVALIILLGFFGGLGPATAGALGSGAKELDA